MRTSRQMAPRNCRFEIHRDEFAIFPSAISNASSALLELAMDWRLLLGIAIGLAVGVISGLIGVGGGIVMVPALIFAFGMDQKMAQGTSLAMLLPPTGILAFMRYYNEGQADLKLGLVMPVGVFIGGYFGGHWAQQIPNAVLRRAFAALLVVIAVKLFREKE